MIAENEQYEHKQSFYHLEVCCRLAGEKFGKQIISTWTNGDYLRLSSAVSRKTNVQISPSTLKRIFGKLKTPERYYPQRATRDALAQFIGFPDWEKFVHQHPKPVKLDEPKMEQSTVKANPDFSSPNKPVKNRRTWLMYLAAAVILLVIVTRQVSRKNIDETIDFKDIKFTCTSPEGGNPHSATFRLTLPKNFTGNASNFKVDFGDGRRPRRSAFDGPLFTHYYEVPGRYYAVLKYNERPLDTIPVYLQTHGWTATAIMEHDSARVYPVRTNLFKNADLMVGAPDVYKAGVDTNRTFYIHFANTQRSGIDGDNFELVADVTASDTRPGLRCSQFNLEVYGERSRHEVILIKPECVAWSVVRFSELFRQGEQDDLSSVGVDLSKRGVVKLEVINKKVRLFINEKVVHQASYKFPLKKIYGVKIIFSGIGTLHNLVMKDLRTGEIFRDGFSSSSKNYAKD